MKGVLHIAPVLRVPIRGVSVEDVSLTVEATHRVLAPYRPVLRKSSGDDRYVVAGLRDSLYGWTVDTSLGRAERPITFQLGWAVRIGLRDRQCQHRLTLRLEAPGRLKDPFWTTDASLWTTEDAHNELGAATPISVFSRVDLSDQTKRDLAITARSRVTTIAETLTIPPMERAEAARLIGERYAVTQGYAA